MALFVSVKYSFFVVLMDVCGTGLIICNQQLVRKEKYLLACFFFNLKIKSAL